MRWPAVASLGIRAKHAECESPWVPWDTRFGPVVSVLDETLDGVEDPAPDVEPPFIWAHPKLNVKRPMAVHTNNLVNDFMSEAPPPNG